MKIVIKILVEIGRVLKHNGVTLLSLNVDSSVAVLFRNILLKPILRRKYPDYVQHPYHFSVKQAIHLVKERFEVISVLKNLSLYALSCERSKKFSDETINIVFGGGKVVHLNNNPRKEFLCNRDLR